MTDSPPAMICAWLDVAPPDRAAFREFHDREHLFERMAVPGFRRGRRFGAIDAPSDFLIVYEIEDLATLSSEAYLARLNAPTPWTLRSLAMIRSSRRSTARVDYQWGEARGGFVLTLRSEVSSAAQWRIGMARLFDELKRQPGIVAIHAGTTDEPTSNIDTAERRIGGWNPQSEEQIVLVESVSTAVLGDLLEGKFCAEELGKLGIRGGAEIGIYGLEICVESILPGTSS